MNPYEKYYLRKKITTGAIAAGVSALAIVGVLLWQPWKMINTGKDQTQQQDQQQQPIVEQPTKKEPDLSITVGGKKVDCNLYEGDGWTIPVPIDWTIEETDDAVHFYPEGGSADGTGLTVTVTDRVSYSGSFVAAGPMESDGMKRLFYFGGNRSVEVYGRMNDDDVENYEKLINAMARSMKINGESPFAALYPIASEPEWQVVDGDVVLFLDKDGIDIESAAEQAVKKKMNAWSSDVKANFTGKYSLGEPEWAGSYTCVNDKFIDVFRVTVQYQVAAGRADSVDLEEGQKIRNGWLIDESTVLYVAFYHDGSVVSEHRSAWGDGDYFGAEFVSDVLK